MGRRRWEKGGKQTFGAASKVRHIDPATYQVQAQETHVEVPRSVKERETLAWLKAADRTLLRDAYARHGKRHRDKVRNKITQGRYR
jgi:hypothetical protein